MYPTSREKTQIIIQKNHESAQKFGLTHDFF